MHTHLLQCTQARYIAFSVVIYLFIRIQCLGNNEEKLSVRGGT